MINENNIIITMEASTKIEGYYLKCYYRYEPGTFYILLNLYDSDEVIYITNFGSIIRALGVSKEEADIYNIGKSINIWALPTKENLAGKFFAEFCELMQNETFTDKILDELKRQNLCV